MTRLALLRHGHTPWNRAGRIQGRSDIALDPQARADLSKLCLPAGWETADLWSSPLSRASETAKLVAGRDPNTSAALIEMHWGDWEGLHGLDLKSDPNSGFRDIEDWGWAYHPPGGESPQDVWNRLQPWLSQIKTDTVAVCHIGIMRVIMAQASGWHFSGPAPFQIKRNRLFVLDLTPNLALSDPHIVRLRERDA
jgi:broad specificity phosphatase PhoE